MQHADVVMASAVLHFARDKAHFEAMLRQLWRVLKPGGIFFARLASTIGIAEQGPSAGQHARSAREEADAIDCPTALIGTWSTPRRSKHGRCSLAAR